MLFAMPWTSVARGRSAHAHRLRRKKRRLTYRRCRRMAGHSSDSETEDENRDANRDWSDSGMDEDRNAEPESEPAGQPADHPPSADLPLPRPVQPIWARLQPAEARLVYASPDIKGKAILLWQPISRHATIRAHTTSFSWGLDSCNVGAPRCWWGGVAKRETVLRSHIDGRCSRKWTFQRWIRQRFQKRQGYVLVLQGC